ncbi:methyltransferase domain-containing protein [Amycolatopsis sp. K13G38]|uniref:Methyltransferase domain-containing protein n=1 Tax=Amycolatopsis acididurans TaxID=2724524 RepID=A0ABX1JKY7_9PSEU|nr:methyltransferase [Amycolatopsis acididurans]NKQ59326.1 methyltransferase domain-containing protein [Amycolatopsis acididurans]
MGGHGHGHGHGHTHDHIDWADRIPDLRKADELNIAAYEEIANRLTGDMPEGSVVVDVGAGAGGMSAALAAALESRGGGRLVLVDAVPELLTVAAEVASGRDRVEVATVRSDVATERLRALVPPARLIWAAMMLHHLPDQQAGVSSFVEALAPGGVLAIVEGGLETECLPWDLGIGVPGLERRLLAARDAWFIDMRASIEGNARMPYGWTTALSRAGLTDVGSFSVVVDHPAPPAAPVREYVLARTAQLIETVGERLDEQDRETARRILDQDDEAYLGHRDDLFMLGVRTIHCGRKP